eukprot:gene4233-4938_t
MQRLVDPQDITSTFDDIGGLDEIVQDIKDTIFLPLEESTFVDTKLFTIPRGILLYGPPGTGKTMIAKAIAKQNGYFFLDINDSVLECKYYGETPKMISAIFSVAAKLQPTIVFFDEIDSIVGKRGNVQNEFSITKKSVLLQLWDGLKDSRIIIIGATNRLESIDEAFLRRLPKKIKVDLPDDEGREKILRILLKGHHQDDFDFKHLAKKTSGMSGSDLSEMVKEASNLVLKNLIKSRTQSPTLVVTMNEINAVIGNFLKHQHLHLQPGVFAKHNNNKVEQD